MLKSPWGQEVYGVGINHTVGWGGGVEPLGVHMTLLRATTQKTAAQICMKHCRVFVCLFVCMCVVYVHVCTRICMCVQVYTPVYVCEDIRGGHVSSICSIPFYLTLLRERLPH